MWLSGISQHSSEKKTAPAYPEIPSFSGAVVETSSDTWEPTHSVIDYAVKHGLFKDNKRLADATYIENAALQVRINSWLEGAMESVRALANGNSPIQAGVKAFIAKRYKLAEDPKGLTCVEKIDLPKVSLTGTNRADYRELFQAIHTTWPKLMRQTPGKTGNSLISLPHPYVVPGGRFNEMYYWDTYFSMLGMNDSGLRQLSKGMVDNCLEMVRRYGHVPNGNRLYYISRSQPPMLTSMIEEVLKQPDLFKTADDKRQWLQKAYKMAKKEYQSFWMKSGQRFLPEQGLNRYFDVKKTPRVESWGTDNKDTPNSPEFFRNERAECESGWDFTDRFDERCTDFLPIDLNCILYKYERDLAQFARQLGNNTEAKQFEKAAEKRKEQIQKKCWNEKDGFFYDFDTRKNEQSKYKSLAGFFPLWAGVATKEQAKAMMKRLKDFQAPGGLMASDKESGKQWDAPNGWAPLQWVVAKGLKNYGYEQEAQDVAKTWLDMCYRVYKKQGGFYEKYNVVERNLETPGGYPLQAGFGWTNGVNQRLLTDILGYSVTGSKRQAKA